MTAQPARGADANPPDRMTYQGFLVDGSNTPLGNLNPRNFDTMFKIYDASQGGTLIWSEQQTITVDKGSFSVLLGEGSAIGAEPRPPLSQVFGGTSASDRFIGITVKGLGATDVEIAPRLRLLPSPYSFLSRNALNLADNNGQPLVTVGTGTLQVSAPMQVSAALTANSFAGNGAQITAINANNIATGTLNAARVPGLDANKIVSGTIADARLSANVPQLDASANTFSGTVNANTVNGFGTIPLGGIIMWSGSQVPLGWALCNGQTVNGRVTPDLRARFVIGAGSGITHAGATGTAATLAGGLSTYGLGSRLERESITLGAGNMPVHSHGYRDGVFAEASGVGNWSSPGAGFYREFVTSGIGANGTDTDNNALRTRNLSTDNAGSGQAFDSRPSYYALAFIMRVQ